MLGRRYLGQTDTRMSMMPADVVSNVREPTNGSAVPRARGVGRASIITAPLLASWLLGEFASNYILLVASSELNVPVASMHTRMNALK